MRSTSDKAGASVTKAKVLTATDVRAELEKIESLVATAARLTNEGRMIDLDALTRRTDETCAAVVALTSAESKSLLPTLETIIAKLDQLAGQLTERFGDMPNLQNEAQPGVAASAYGRLQDSGQ